MSEYVKGLEKLIKTLENIPKELTPKVDAVIEDNARQIELHAKEIVPVGTPESTGIKGYIGGTLRQSIKSEKEKELTYTVRANSTGLAPYAPFVEFGTYKMRAQPYLYPAYFRQIPKLQKDLEDLLNEYIASR